MVNPVNGPALGKFSIGPLTYTGCVPAPLGPRLRIQPSSEKKLKVTRLDALTRNAPVNTAWKLVSSPAPACWFLPCAGNVLHEPSGCGTTLVKGRVEMSTPVLLVQGTVPTGGLKLMTGNSWVNATGVVGVPVNGPEFSTLGIKLPETELMLIAGVSAP